MKNIYQQGAGDLVYAERELDGRVKQGNIGRLSDTITQNTEEIKKELTSLEQKIRPILASENAADGLPGKAPVDSPGSSEASMALGKVMVSLDVICSRIAYLSRRVDL